MGHRGDEGRHHLVVAQVGSDQLQAALEIGDGDRAEVALRLRGGGEVAAVQARTDLAAVALRAGWVEVNLGDGAIEVGAGFRERAAALGDSTGALICRCGVTVACGLLVVCGHDRPVVFSRGAV